MLAVVGIFVVSLAVVLGKIVHLQAVHGEAYRAEAARPLLRESPLPAGRGRILSRGGVVLAHDKPVVSLVLHYGQLRPGSADQSLHIRLAKLCGMSSEQWDARRRRIQARVEHVADSVNRRRARQHRLVAMASEQERNASGGARVFVEALFAPPEDLPPPRVTVVEQLDFHVMASDVSSDVVAQIESHPAAYPGVKIIEQTRRDYPSGSLAAHLLGHLGAIDAEQLDHAKKGAKKGAYLPEQLVGRAGLERQYEALLRGRHGVSAKHLDRRGRVLQALTSRQPIVGGDLVTTLDVRLQKTAETLLDAALRRREKTTGNDSAGGAVVVMDVQTGALLAAASAPRFDPNVIARGDEQQIDRMFTDRRRPMFDRTTQMALPPGSVFKTLSAVALLQSETVAADQTFRCRGYLHEPDRFRCLLHRHRGVGHNDVALSDALARSCNVYFFHFASQMGSTPLVEWALKFGYHRPTGVDLPGEASGQLPSPVNIERLERHRWRVADTRMLAIGQSSLTVTPLQVARMMAAVANGGYLVTPHLAAVDDGATSAWVRRKIADLRPEVLARVREGLDRVVSDPSGTAHATVHLASTSIAGKTGTAEAHPDRADHAWFAGYAPADHPRVAFVVVLEHAGSGAAAAGPVAKRLVSRLQQLGYLDPSPTAEEKATVAGKIRNPN
jgi:penicillin-binding protein 2